MREGGREVRKRKKRNKEKRKNEKKRKHSAKSEHAVKKKVLCVITKQKFAIIITVCLLLYIYILFL